MAVLAQANFIDFLSHLADCGVYHDPSQNVNTDEGYEWGFFISPDNSRTKQILLNRDYISKLEMEDICRCFRIQRLKAVL